MRDFTSGRPSVSFISSRISSRDMRRARRWRHHSNGASTAATNSNPPESMSIATASNQAPRPIATSTGKRPSAKVSGTSCQATPAATPPTTSTFSKALPNSIKPAAPKTRVKPRNGSSREKSGRRAEPLNNRPPSSAGAATAATKVASNKGASVSKASMTASPSANPMLSGA